MEASTGWRAVSRRHFLVGAAVAPALGWLVSCTPSPLIDSGTERTPMPAPTVSEQCLAAAELTQGLLTMTMAATELPNVTDQFADWCRALAQLHQTHLTVLLQANPLGGVQANHTPLATPPPFRWTPFANQAIAMAQIADAESLLAAKAAEFAGTAELTSPMALFWVAQVVSARTHGLALAQADPARLGPAPVVGAAVPAEFSLGNPNEARQVLLSHQRALVFGLQTILGSSARGGEHDPAIATRLVQAMQERDATAAQLRQASAEPDPPAKQYELPGQAGDPGQHHQIWGRLEYAVLTGWGRLAATDATARETATAQMITQAGRARDLGVALPYWPGWV